jgi:hypothetical protein
VNALDDDDAAGIDRLPLRTRALICSSGLYHLKYVVALRSEH